MLRMQVYVHLSVLCCCTAVFLALGIGIPDDWTYNDNEAALERQRRAVCNPPCSNGGYCYGANPPCLCDLPYIGAYCAEIVDYCVLLDYNGQPAPSPCQNGANCTGRLLTKPYYSCSCVAGYSGTNCETDIDDCASKPCANGRCSDRVNDFSCSCYTGWEGRNCDVNHQDCFNGACLHSGRCIDGNRTYTCDCSSTGFNGTNCETNIDDCAIASKPCANGQCVDLVKNYSCSCYTGWEGRDCSVDTDYCRTAPCLNGGHCADGNSSFTCNCSAVDYSGPTCSSPINDCSPNPCLNGGVCSDGVRSFTCDCANTGFYGTTCSLNIDDCSPSPCANGATCVDGVNNYSCSCYAGYSGKNCSDDTLDCIANRCDYGGTCLERSSPSLYNNLSLPPPFNGSFNYSLAAGFMCLCVPGSFGPTCSVNPNDCLIAGTNQSVCVHASNCTDGLASYTCQCLPGYDNQNCSHNIDDCSPNPCANGATCVDGVKNYSCSCQPDYGGRICSVQLPSFTFGSDGNASSATFASLPAASNAYGSDDLWSVEMKLLTLSPGAFVMMLGDPSNSTATPRMLVSILPSGQLSAQLLLSISSVIARLDSAVSVATGSFVAVKVSLSISRRLMSLTASSSVSSASFSSVSSLAQPMGQLIIGGFAGVAAAPAPSLAVSGVSRSKRSAPALSSSVVSSLASNISGFRGIVSSPRLNEARPLILGGVSSSLIDSLPGALSASDSTGVLVGAVSETVCKRYSPCQNGATCTDVFYNSFSCKCSAGLQGVTCNQTDICFFAAKFCPSGTVCINVEPLSFDCRGGSTRLPTSSPTSSGVSEQIREMSSTGVAAAVAGVLGVAVTAGAFLLVLFLYKKGQVSLGIFDRRLANQQAAPQLLPVTFPSSSQPTAANGQDNGAYIIAENADMQAPDKEGAYEMAENGGEDQPNPSAIDAHYYVKVDGAMVNLPRGLGCHGNSGGPNEQALDREGAYEMTENAGETAENGDEDQPGPSAIDAHCYVAADSRMINLPSGPGSHSNAGGQYEQITMSQVRFSTGLEDAVYDET